MIRGGSILLAFVAALVFASSASAVSFDAHGSVEQVYATGLPTGMSTSLLNSSGQVVATRNAVIIGPADTPFEDGTFRLVMNFEEQYPNKPPGVKFISQMFHPNVYGTGELCLDILQNRWSPTYEVAAILTSIQRYRLTLRRMIGPKISNSRFFLVC